MYTPLPRPPPGSPALFRPGAKTRIEYSASLLLSCQCMINARSLLIAYVGLSTPAFMCTPQLLYPLIAYLSRPALIFGSNPWYLPLPILGLFISVGLVFAAENRSGKFRLFAWGYSVAYWSAWTLYFLIDKTTGLDHWIIWCWHLLLMLFSLFMINRAIILKPP